MLIRPLIHSVLLIGFAAAASAQDSNGGPGSADGPGRGVARISLINGDVSVRRGDSGDLIAAAINSPLVVQDRLITGPTSRAEVQFDWANMVRLSHDAEIRLAELENKRYLLQVARGTVTFRVLRDHDAEVELSTPSVAVRPVKRGTYRITVRDDGTSEITVRSGEAEIFTPKGSERLPDGKTMVARGTTAEPEFRIAKEIGNDEWDQWNQRRDRDLEKTRSYSYVSRDIYGADDLDDHGRWVNVADHGWVWSPRVAAGWAPYRYGRWSWIDYYGWSWVSYDPWGWAPYHYGRWFYSAPYGWCWWPGSFGTRHYWSPGLVAFFGFGSVGVGFGFGNVGWVPLAPYERYYPWYGRGYYGNYRYGGYGYNNVRIVNNVNVTNIYRNSRVDHGVTVVDRDGFGRGRVGTSARVRDGEFSRASVMQGQLPVTPERYSMRLADREASVRPMEGRDSTQFFSRRQPAAVDRVAFEDQRSGVEQAVRRTFAGDSGRVDNSPARADSASQVSGSDRGWRRVGEGTRSFDAQTTRGERATDRVVDSGRVGDGVRADENGWRRFGSPRVDSQSTNPVRGDRADRAGQFGQPSVDGARSGVGQDRSADPSSDSDRGWRRVGAETGRSLRTSETGSERNADWRGFNGRTGSPSSVDSNSSVSRPERSAEGSGRSGAAQSQRFGGFSESGTPRTESRSQSFGGDSVRISPPIVRERSSDRGSFGGGSGARSAPAAPQMSAPRGGGGGFGGNSGGARGGGFSGGGRGGGGGSSRSGGGGGGRSR